MNDAVILQHCSTASTWQGAPQWGGIFYDMLRLITPRHSAYARAWKFDYRVSYGDIVAGKWPGAWGKIYMVLDAFAAGYKYAVWIDTDAAVMDFNADLRNALPEGALIGAVEHDPARSPYLANFKVPRHKNVGVLYVKNTPETVKFFEDWRDSYPGDDRWFEQGIFNQLSEGNPIVAAVDDKWNATINVNMVDKPVVLGWHGIQPAEKRLAMMKKELEHDFLMFRV